MGSIQNIETATTYVVIPNSFTVVSVGRPLLLCDLIASLDKLDSAEIPWHIARGLPLEFQQGDSIVMSSKEMEGNSYWQEWYKYSTDCNGKFKVHRVRMDAPKGSGVILTDDQYLYAINKKTLLDKIYQDKLKKFKQKLWKQIKNNGKVEICLICKERFQFYNDV